ncbi:MAG: hypothetical protein KF887_18190 [Paracoccaceae bacterium]|nr:MAG: hypothetical protein KF887_18190 [Paracoccaceae bacterium]
MPTLADFPDLTAAETRLVDWLQARDRRICEISGAVPDSDTPDVTLRASLLRELALGKVEGVPLPETGLRVRGAWIRGDGPAGAETRGLDLEGCRLPGDLALIACRFPEMVLLRGAKAESLFLNGSRLQGGLGADRLQAGGGVFLRGVTATGEVRLPGARLGGNLDCEGAQFTAQGGGHALSADRLQAEGSVFLRGVTATGAVRLLGAWLGGNLDCEGAQFTAQGGGHALSADGLQAEGDVVLRGVTATGAVRLLGAGLGGDLDCEGAQFTAQGGGHALSADGAKVAGTFFLRGAAQVGGLLSLVGAEFGAINDDPACWPGAGNLSLDRCRYGAFTGRAPVDGPSRIRWLALQDASRFGEEFWPQPHEECARVLREAGHGGAARAVLIEKERRQRAAKRARIRREDRNFGVLRGMGRWLVDEVLLGATIRYGRAPMLAFAWLFGLWVAGWVVFAGADAAGALKPNLPQLQRAPEWVLCGAEPGVTLDGPSLPTPRAGLRAAGETQYACFLRQPEAASYPLFNAAIYSADTLLPVVSLEMQSYWLPDDRTDYGRWARRYLWLQIGLGWGLTLLAVAGFSGLVKQDSK